VRRLPDRLTDILEAIAAIEEAASRGRSVFDTDRYVQTYIVHNLQVIGEAVRPFSDELRALRPAVPWAKIVGLRHILVHHYFGVDREAVWAAVQEDLPALKAVVQSLLADLDALSSGEGHV